MEITKLKPQQIAIAKYGVTTLEGVPLLENFIYVAIPLFGKTDLEKSFEKSFHEEMGHKVFDAETRNLDSIVEKISQSITFQYELATIFES